MIETLHPPTPERIAHFDQAGYDTTSDGRPLHPWIAERDMQLGEDTTLWQWGQNAAADAIVFNRDRPEVMLIQRQDGSWANAGGFIDAADTTSANAAAREAYEEAGIILNPAAALPVYEGIVNDSRASRYSWVTSAAFLWRTSLTLDALTAGDDAQGIRLMDLADVRTQQLSGSHNQLIEMAVNQYGTLQEKLQYYQPESQPATATGGHMGYCRTVTTLPTGEQIFTKQYAPWLYSDQNRADRSLLYLQKEAATYQALRGAGYEHIPITDYANDTLAIAALTPEAGWHWRTPQSHRATAAYISNTLAALTELQAVPCPLDTSGITPSHVSFFEEGWGDYSADNKDRVVQKLFDYAVTVNSPDLADAAYRLSDQLDALYHAAATAPPAAAEYFCHHDFRESNFAWHPTRGVNIIDWSWAGPGVKNADATTFLIDLHKRGVDVSSYMQNFNKNHALTMIGFWLQHSIWPASDDPDVRFQQVHSAVAAYDLLCSLQ